MSLAAMPQALRMRSVASADDSFAAGEILMLFIGDEPWKVDDLVGGCAFNAVEIAEDGSVAVFEVLGGSDWDATGAPSRASARPPIADLVSELLC